MSTHKEYKNDDGIIITEQQAKKIKKFKENIFENNRKKCSNFYNSNEIVSTYIYIYPDEDLNTELSKLNPNIEYTIFKDMEIINGYTQWKNYGFKDGNLSSDYGIDIFDSNRRNIVTKFSDDSYLIKKYFLEGKHVYNEEREWDFYFNEDAQVHFTFKNGILSIDVKDNLAEDPFLDKYLFYGTYEDLLSFMTPEIFEYFTNQEPLVPPMQLY